MKFSLYPPTAALAVLCGGIGMVSVPSALIVAGALLLCAQVAYFVARTKAGK
jgi:hypothetical protein